MKFLPHYVGGADELQLALVRGSMQEPGIDDGVFLQVGPRFHDRLCDQTISNVDLKHVDQLVPTVFDRVERLMHALFPLLGAELITGHGRARRLLHHIITVRER